MTMNTSQLLGLPEEVFYGYVFPKVSTNDSLRMRRTCKTVKLYADAYLRLHYLTQEREINHDIYSFANFIRLDFPCSKIFLNNRNTVIFQQPEVALFLEKYADQITHLRVNFFETCLSDAEKKFYAALTNLQHLEIMLVDASDRYVSYIPPTFENLKTLKLHDLWTTGPSDQTYYFGLVKFCVNLEHLKHPRFFDGVTIERGREYQQATFDVVTTEIEKRLKDDPDYKTPLKVFDLEYEEELGYYEPSFLRLMSLADTQGVQLWNVNSKLIGRRVAYNVQSLSNTLISVRNLSNTLFHREMQHLESVKITTLKKVDNFYRWRHGEENEYHDADVLILEQLKWPQLKELDLHIDNVHTGDEIRYSTRRFYEFFLETVEQPHLTTLRLAFDRNDIWDSQELPCPRAAKLVEKCSNLKILHIYNWHGTNKALSKLWEGLENLEEVSLDRCKMLGNVAFVGNQIEDPTFLKLNCLRKFSLSGLDKMPKVTDKIFQLVFKNMKIKEFCITSDQPISSVTIQGIRTLTEGNFQNSVEKFVFAGWSLKGVGKEDWDQLKNEFRASHML